VDAPLSSVYAAIERLLEAKVLRPLTNRSRNQIWGASLILDELDDLGVRMAARPVDHGLVTCLILEDQRRLTCRRG